MFHLSHSLYLPLSEETAGEEMAISGILSNFRSFFTTNSFERLVSFGGDDPLQTTGRTFSASFFSSNALLRRLWSFDSSDQPDQTMAESIHPSAGDVENPIPRAMDMETAGSPTAADPEQDSKRVRKLVPTVSLAVTALCSGVYATIPRSDQRDPSSHPYDAILLAFIALGVFTGLGLFMYSLVRPRGNEVAWFQKRLVVIVIIFFSIAFVLRISLHLSAASSGHVWLLFFLVTAVIVLYLYTAWKKNNHNQTARDPDLPI